MPVEFLLLAPELAVLRSLFGLRVSAFEPPVPARATGEPGQ